MPNIAEPAMMAGAVAIVLGTFEFIKVTMAKKNGNGRDVVLEALADNQKAIIDTQNQLAKVITRIDTNVIHIFDKVNK